MCAGNQKLPFQLDEGMGSVRRVQEECPGVFHVTTNISTEHFCREHYVVTAAASRTQYHFPGSPRLWKADWGGCL